MKKKKKISYKKLTITIMMLLSIITNSYLIYTIYLLSGIETIGRYLFISLLFLIDLLIFTEWIKFIKRKRKNRYYSIFNFLLIIYLFFNIFVGFFINKIYTSIDNVSKEYVTHSTSLVVMKNSSVNNIKDVLNLKIGIIKDKESLDGYIISQEIIKENKLSNNIFIEYEGFATMLVDLYDKKIDAIFISSSYANMFSSIEKFTNI
ncbi:MAG: hypothetical protein RR404_00890, partial [Bacilli bacterium]